MLVALALPVAGGVAGPPPGAASTPTLTVSAGVAGTGAAERRGGEGSVSERTRLFRVDGSWASPRVIVGVSAGRERTVFEARDLPAGGVADLGTLHGTSAGLRAIRPGPWTWVGRVGVAWRGEREQPRRDALTVSAVVSAMRDWGNGFRAGLAAVGAARLEEDPLLLVVPVIEWRISPGWRLRTERGLSLQYAPDPRSRERWEASLLYEEQSYRLDDAGPPPGGVFARRAWEGRLAWKRPWGKRLVSNLFVGAPLRQRYEVLDARGSRVERFRTGETFSAGVALAWRL